MYRFTMLSLLVLLGCPPPTPVAPPVDASDAQPPTTVIVYPPSSLGDAALTPDCSGACRVLRQYGCPEGFGVDGGDSCETTCASHDGVFDFKPACIVAQAASLVGVISCGTVTCKGVSAKH